MWVGGQLSGFLPHRAACQKPVETCRRPPGLRVLVRVLGLGARVTRVDSHGTIPWSFLSGLSFPSPWFRLPVIWVPLWGPGYVTTLSLAPCLLCFHPSGGFSPGLPEKPGHSACRSHLWSRVTRSPPRLCWESTWPLGHCQLDCSPLAAEAAVFFIESHLVSRLCDSEVSASIAQEKGVMPAPLSVAPERA